MFNKSHYFTIIPITFDKVHILNRILHKIIDFSLNQKKLYHIYLIKIL